MDLKIDDLLEKVSYPPHFATPSPSWPWVFFYSKKITNIYWTWNMFNWMYPKSLGYWGKYLSKDDLLAAIVSAIFSFFLYLFNLFTFHSTVTHVTLPMSAIPIRFRVSLCFFFSVDSFLFVLIITLLEDHSPSYRMYQCLLYLWSCVTPVPSRDLWNVPCFVFVFFSGIYIQSFESHCCRIQVFWQGFIISLPFGSNFLAVPWSLYPFVCSTSWLLCELIHDVGNC